MLNEVKKVFKDCCTSANGDYDPARVIGYGIVMIGSLEFMILTAYMAITKGVFDSSQFAVGLTGISGVITAAAAGVWLKKTTEIEPEKQTPP